LGGGGGDCASRRHHIGSPGISRQISRLGQEHELDYARRASCASDARPISGARPSVFATAGGWPGRRPPPWAPLRDIVKNETQTVRHDWSKERMKRSELRSDSLGAAHQPRRRLRRRGDCCAESRAKFSNSWPDRSYELCGAAAIKGDGTRNTWTRNTWMRPLP